MSNDARRRFLLPMIPNALRRAVSHLLKALGLARVAEVDHERRVARAIRETERERLAREVGAASAKLDAVQAKLRATHEHFDIEHTGRLAAAEKLRSLRARLEATEADLEVSRASERLMKAVYGSPTDRLVALLRIKADLARASTRLAPEDADRDAHLESVCADYVTAKAGWRNGSAVRDLDRVCIAGVHWSVPADARQEGSLSRRLLDDHWLPLDDLAVVRQFAVGDVMLDIGANIGTTSIPRVLLGDFACAYAAEPNSDNYFCLVGNVLDNRVAGRVLPDRVAISSADGTVRVRRSVKIGGHNILPSGAAVAEAAEEVPGLTVNTWLERLGVPPETVRFVKVDTQGWDLHVMQGASALLCRRDVVWQIEVSPSMMKDAGSTLDDLCRLVRAHFTHVKDVGGHSGIRWRRSAEAGALLDALLEERRFANLLLFNFG